MISARAKQATYIAQVNLKESFDEYIFRHYFSYLIPPPQACWMTDHYHLSSNLGVDISGGYFIVDFASLLLEVAQSI